MAAETVIALDAMGGDKGPSVVVGGAAQVATRFPEVRFLLFGDEAQLRPLLNATAILRDRVSVRHTTDMVAGDEKPSVALRRGKNTSLRLAVDAVAAGEASAVVSAGNTGALMAIAKFVLRTMPGIDRPALASFLPSVQGECVMLDLGANVESDANNLVQFAVMGANFAHSVLGRERPLVGLLNVGSEELKGHLDVRAAADMLRKMPNLAFDFHGFVEGDDICKGTVDVVVTDGFTGNVALKTAEGTAKLVSTFLRAAFASTFISRLAYLLARPALGALRDRIDPRYYNGGVFLGLNGIVVKAHGGSDAVAFASALSLAVDMARDGLVERIAAEFKDFAVGAPEPAVRVGTP
jgi:glycerol-3-phosphate acyltransferase PlsX